MKKMATAAVGLLVFLMCHPATGSDEIKLGVLAFRGELEAIQRWGAFGDYLSDQLGQAVAIVPLAPPVLTQAVAEKKVDFALANPVQSAVLLDRQGCVPLATLNMANGPRFAGVIIAKKGRGIVASKDLKGKNVMSLSWKRAAGAYMFQAYHLSQKGIDPHQDFASFKEGKYQDDLVLAVQKGFIDAAFVRSGLLERMQKEGKIQLADFEIVDQRNDEGFSLRHSTALYPEWCLAARPEMDAALRDRVKAAVLNLAPDADAAQKARIKGFVPPLPYQPITDMLKRLNIPPFDQ